jgi:hypothetical protein
VLNDHIASTTVAITEDERKRLTQYLTETRERLLGTARGLSPQQLDHKPAPDRWSVAEVLEHLTVAESRLLPRIEETLRGSHDAAKASAWEGREEALLQFVISRSPRVQAPDPIQPTGRWGHEELFRQLEAVRGRTTEFAATTNAPVRNFFHLHPVLGELDCYQWLLITGAHWERHRAQIEEVMADVNFPRRAGAA